MTTVVLGAGGLGSYLAAVLDRAERDVVLIARGEHGRAIGKEGLTIEAPEGDFVAHPRCVGSAMDVDQASIAFLTVKAFSLHEVMPQLHHLVRSGAAIVPLLNGVDTVERLVVLGIPPERLVPAIAYLTAFRLAPGRVERRGTHQRILIGQGAKRALAGAPEAAAVLELFGGTDIDAKLSPDLRPELWNKMAVVCALTTLCCLTGTSLGPVRRHRLGAGLQRRAVAEVLAVGRACGVPIPRDEEGEVGAILDAFPDDFYPSVLHDLRSGRRTEIAALNGTISRLGAELAVPTPLNDATTWVVELAGAG